MKILAVEFSSELRSVAVVQSGGEAGGTVLARVAEQGNHRAFGMVAEALRQADCEREEMDVLAIGLGPGSYTGIRGAIALAQGWQLGRGLHVVGLGSVACLAAGAARAGASGPASFIIDAQRNEFYLARYQIGPGSWRELEALRLAPCAEIEALAQRGERVLGPGASKWFPTAQDVFPDAALLGMLASERRDFVPAEKLEPIYLRETAFKKSPPTRLV